MFMLWDQVDWAPSIDEVLSPLSLDYHYMKSTADEQQEIQGWCHVVILMSPNKWTISTDEGNQALDYYPKQPLVESWILKNEWAMYSKRCALHYECYLPCPYHHSIHYKHPPRVKITLEEALDVCHYDHHRKHNQGKVVQPCVQKRVWTLWI